MNVKTLTCAIAALALAAGGFAAPEKAKGKAAEKADKVTIQQFPKLGRQSTLDAPGLSGGSTIGVAWTGKPRKWIVLETKYDTTAKWTDQLTFTWHVLLETATATSKDKDDREKMAPYSYFTQTVTYYNIPRGSHAASVCLPPSYLERFGEARVVGITIADKNGEVVEGDTESAVKAIKPHTKFWEDPKIMDAKDKAGEPLIERRQGLLDRAKTIWALVNPNDYETAVQ